jgi:outer membrane immunogenic protein
MKTPLLAGVAAGAVLVGCTANAADLNFYKAPPAAAPLPVLSWTGCYIGAHIGAGWGHDDLAGAGAPHANSTTRTATIVPATVSTTGSAPPAADLESFFVGFDRVDTSGILGGGQGGCDYQIAPNWLIGIEGEGAGADIHGSAVDPFFPGGTVGARADWLASVTGRIGWAWNRWLLYAKGGVAWVDDKYDLGGTYPFYGPSGSRAGWTVGAGVEYAFWSSWSAFVEYDFYGFGTHDLMFQCASAGGGGCASGVPVSVKQDLNTMKFGVNYHFNWGAPPGR